VSVQDRQGSRLRGSEKTLLTNRVNEIVAEGEFYFTLEGTPLGQNPLSIFGSIKRLTHAKTQHKQANQDETTFREETSLR